MRLSKILLVAFAALCFSAPLSAQIYAVTGGTVVTVTKSEIENGTVIFENGTIKEVGSNLTVPAGAIVIDATGKFVFPGMIDINTTLGLSDVSGIWQTTDNRETGKFNSDIRASQGFNADNRQINMQRYTGVTTAIATPSAEIIGGQEFLFNLNGWSNEHMIIRDPVSMQITYPSAQSRSRYGPPQPATKEQKEEAKKNLTELNDLLNKALKYADAIDASKNNTGVSAPPVDLRLEGLVKVVRGEIPVTLNANGIDDIRKAIEFVQDHNLKAVLVGASDAYKIADEIAAAGIPVAYSELLKLPDMDVPYDLYYAIPTIFRDAGVLFSFHVPSHADVRNLPFMAGMSVPYGLSKEDALKAVTINPAKMYGIDDILGSIEVGKMANLVISNGHLLEPSTIIDKMFIDGDEVNLGDNDDYQKYLKYRTRPDYKKKK